MGIAQRRQVGGEELARIALGDAQIGQRRTQVLVLRLHISAELVFQGPKRVVDRVRAVVVGELLQLIADGRSIAVDGHAAGAIVGNERVRRVL